MSRVIGSIVFVCALSLMLAACGSGSTEGGGGEEAATPTAEAPAKVELPCVDDNNKAVDDAGEVTRCKLSADFEIDGHPCQSGKMVTMHSNGKLKECYMSAAQDVDGFQIKDGLSLYESGKFRRGKLEADRTVDTIELKKGDWITVYESGKLKRLELFGGARDLKGMPCKSHQNFLHENGQLQKCLLSEDKTIDGVAHKADEFVCWDDTGKVAECNTMRFDLTS